MIFLALRTLTAYCSQTVGRIPLEPALKGQYESLMVKKLRCAFEEQYGKKSIILFFLIHILHRTYFTNINFSQVLQTFIKG